MAPRSALLCGLLLSLALSGCSGSDDGPPSSSAASAPLPGVTLPAGPLSDLVPAPSEVPPGMNPLLTATGPRDAGAIAAFSRDPVAAGKALKDHGFRRAYVAQYAHPSDGRVLSVVAVEFATVQGATDDLKADLAASAGTKVSTDKVGDQSSATTQALPGGGGGQLLTLRFRSGPRTWLVAFGSKGAPDPAVAVRIGKSLVARSIA